MLHPFLEDDQGQGQGQGQRQGPANQPERVPTESQHIIPGLDAIKVMVSLMGIFLLQYLFLNGYLTLLLISMLLAGALEVPANALRLFNSDPLARRMKVKFCFLLCGTLSIYAIIYFGVHFNSCSCSCNGSDV